MTCAAIQTGPRTLNCEGPPAGANDHSPAYGQSSASQVPHVTSPHTSQSPAGGTGLIKVITLKPVTESTNWTN